MTDGSAATPVPSRPVIPTGRFRFRTGRFLPDGKLKQKRRRRQESLRRSLQVGLVNPNTGDTTMKKTLALLAATTALGTVISLPAWSTPRVSVDDGAALSLAAFVDDGSSARPLVFVSDDGDEDRDDDDRDDDDRDDDDRDDDDDDDDDCDDGDCRGAASNPAPAGTVTPPQNGLFGSGAAPQVQTN
jgi:hypothetical protein